MSPDPGLEAAVDRFVVEGADAYIESTPGATERMVRILMRPEHWLTRDYTKLSS